MTVTRRVALGATFGLLAAPRLAGAADARTLRFVPQADLASLDPIQSTAYVTRNHAYLVYDTLYGTDESYAVHPQMAAGHVVEDDGKVWTITLRDGLRFHDGTPVLARDVVASLNRWGRRDLFGQTLFGLTDDLSAISDKALRFRLKQPFPHLPTALGKPQSSMPCIMPERLAATDPSRQVTEVIGSGPFRFLPNERVAGDRVLYARFADYVPRQDGTPSFTAGPKVAHLDRIEWRILPDPSTAAAALQTGEVDWWEQPTTDLLPLMRRDRNVTVEILDASGLIGNLRLNHLQPPFNNPAVRRAILGAIRQADFMIAVAGNDPSLWREKVGYFTPGSPAASDVGLEVFGSRSVEQSKADLAAAGYRGERVVMMAPGDYAQVMALSQVGADLFRRIGLNVDFQAADWGTVVQRRARKDALEAGGWSCVFGVGSGSDFMSPAAHLQIRANGANAWVGWPDSPRLEALRTEWLGSSDPAEQKRLTEAMQVQALQDVPYVPLGQFFQPTAYRRGVSGIPKGFAQFYGVRKAA